MKGPWRCFTGLAPAWQAVVVLVLLAVFGTVIGIASSGSGSKSAASSETTATTATQPAATTPPPPPPPPPTPSPPPPATAQTPPGDNMNYRTRRFVTQLRACQTSVALLASILKAAGAGGQTTLVQLSDSTSKVKDICDGVRNRMFEMDTKHFDDQALEAETAVDEYSKGLSDVSDYIDTQTPSKVVHASGHFTNGRSYAAEALRTINERRAVYGLPPIH